MKHHLYSPTHLLFEAMLPKTPCARGCHTSRIKSAARTLRIWRERTTTRRQLGELDARMLNDIGLSDFDAKLEAAKPFWIE